MRRIARGKSEISLVKGPEVGLEGELSVNSSIAQPTSTPIDDIFELSPGSDLNR
jgi:hypothetical protein